MYHQVRSRLKKAEQQAEEPPLLRKLQGQMEDLRTQHNQALLQVMQGAEFLLAFLICENGLLKHLVYRGPLLLMHKPQKSSFCKKQVSICKEAEIGPVALSLDPTMSILQICKIQINRVCHDN